MYLDVNPQVLSRAVHNGVVFSDADKAYGDTLRAIRFEYDAATDTLETLATDRYAAIIESVEHKTGGERESFAFNNSPRRRSTPGQSVEGRST